MANVKVWSWVICFASLTIMLILTEKNSPWYLCFSLGIWPTLCYWCGAFNAKYEITK